MTFTPGQTGHTAEHNSIRADLDGRLSDETLAETFVGHGEVDGAFATVLADPESESATALNAAIVDSGNVPVDYTWDATTGFIATITEHYPAPIGNRVTTYSSYGTYGPTHEVDPDGGAWTLTYDANGNPIGRTAA